ncbi:MAG: major facilitator superfamily 1 [Firmicutes bacterium]|nr:major facilitator superfamily 1 [Bacillota bacterium]
MSEALAAKIPQKRWLRIIPPAILVYIFAYMDRVNIGFAIAGGMNESLGLSATVAGMAAGIFFLGYLFLQVPGGHIAERGSAKKFIAATILVWGVISIMTGFVTNQTQLLILRFILGVSEGGVFPAMLVIISHWFPVEERARANAFFIMNLAIASMVTGPVSGWLISTWGWQYVFIVEGAVSLVLLLIWWPFIDDRPEDAKWISPEERDYLIMRREQEKVDVQSAVKADVSYKDILFDINVWKLIVFFFCYMIGILGYTMWLPTILKSLMKTGMTAVGFLSAIPYIATIAGQFLFATLSDRSMNRRLYIAIPAAGFALCFFLATMFKSNIWVSFGFLVGCGFFMQAFAGSFWTIPRILLPSHVVGGATGMINAIGNLGGFVGPLLVGWLITQTGNTDAGVYAMGIALLISFVVAFTLPASTAGAPKAVAVQTAESK